MRTESLRVARADLVLRLPAAEPCVEGEVVGDLQTAAQEEGHAEGRNLDRQPGDGWAEGLGYATERSGGGDRAGPLGGGHDRDHVGLTSRHVHLRDGEAC